MSISRFRDRLGKLVALVLFTAIAGLFMSGSVANHFIFYPMRYPDGDWELQRSAGAEDRWFHARDATRLNAWYFPLPQARVTLFLHGNAGNLTHRIDHAAQIRAAGSAVMLLDYRGYGKSEGRPTERGIYQDGDAAYDELVRMGFTPRNIILHGESLGTAVAVDLASRRPCAGLILEAPFTSAQDVAATLLPLLGPILVRGLESKRKLPQVHAPVLIIHGDQDEMIPFTQGQKMFETANNPKWFWQIKGATHNDLLEKAGPEYIPRLKEFYERPPS